MKHLTIIVPNGENNISSITGAFEIFTKANFFRKGKTGEELFTIQLAGFAALLNLITACLP